MQGGKCKRCGRRYKGLGVCPSSWGFFRRQGAAARGYESNDLYCSEKCRDEAEGGAGGGGGESSSSGSSSSDSDLSPGCSSVLGKIITGVFVILGLIVVLAVIFGKNEDANDPAVKMEKWHEHLEKRRAAFAEGLPEEGVEARGFKNYTWEEWQNRSKKPEKPSETTVKKEGKSLRDLWLEHQSKRRDLINRGISSSKADEVGYNVMTFDEFKARFKDGDVEAEMKKLEARAAAMLEERRKQEPQKSTAVPNVENPKPVTPTAVLPEKPAAQRKPVASAATATSSSADGVRENGVPSRQQNGTSHKTTKDSKMIIITAKGKGQTRAAAVRSALCFAVFKAVGTWVGSKTRMEENREKVIAQVATVTEADVPKFDVIDARQQDGGFVAEVRASVSKKNITPKLAGVFPDVFVMPTVAVPSVTEPVKPAVPSVTEPVKPAVPSVAEPAKPAVPSADKTVNAAVSVTASTKTPIGGAGTDGAISGHQNGTGHKASKDSKGIRIIVQGKGRTKDAAVRYALRQAVWRTVGTWVDSKERIAANRAKVIALVETITEADVRAFEVMDTQKQNGGFVVKVRVSVSKKKIAPKFATVFPDVFTLD
ncbi:MAG: hypothetical protein IJL17_23320 [Kiritimatiellae bacterium]|nr:hypothetical protein [Kiritimatiellia bacterium]